MSKIFLVMGKSATGKDTIYKRMVEDRSLHLKTLVTYTTRPIRNGETDGKEYFFVTKKELEKFRADGKIIECRTYHTVHGDWHYFMVDDGQIQDGEENYIMISTLEGYEALVNYFGPERVVPVYVQVEDGIRLTRALEREKRQQTPKYAEMCRRFLADQEDFREEELNRLGITKRYENTELEKCISQIIADIQR
ncbi:MAG: guanylate kinase [Lachnospiraceae bacterium]|nr:guanylate kinase [Lachnospiraceae bacterium]